jgi:L-asparaginase II
MGLGIALKVTDGATRAAEMALLALPRHTGALDTEACAGLSAYIETPVKNRAGIRMGVVRVAPDGEMC